LTGSLPSIDGFRSGEKAGHLVEAIREASKGVRMTVMEVCGTHTMAIARYGIRELLPEAVELISGPGCPVCVTPNPLLDRAVALSRLPDVTVATFGDMMRVPGSSSSLERERASGRDVRVVFSTLNALDLAFARPDRRVVFFGIGFETTAPTVAASILEARRRGLKNYFVLSAHKTMPRALEALVAGEARVDGYLLPGHVSAIIGMRPYEALVRRYGIGGVVSGFEPMDILRSILMLVRQRADGTPRVEVEYSRVVRPEGNPKALAVLAEVFEPCDAEWRGLGLIPGSGLRIRNTYSAFDAVASIPVDVESPKEPDGFGAGRSCEEP
jgi:hydrogenase expression/formation protein HypD